ncbi:uncharacterized protein LOC132575555, partial [Heteronotia binoei]|uniref:uncharacterized protein LOC132575555 n=1 Tax=Heteronotia binoei TaxID=13085 RepID=UPI0029300C0A
LQKFQQKARKQTKQKKSKSAEFLMGKEERAGTEGIANPAFNISSTDLSASQTSEEEIIRHDKLDSTRAAHQQKLGLQARAEPRGNECSRNYFDPLMDEEINPRQCGMEVSEEGEVELNERLIYEKLMTFLYEENSMMESQETQVNEKDDEGISDSAHPASHTRTGDLCEETEDEETLPYIEHFDEEVQDEMIVLDNLLLEQSCFAKAWVIPKRCLLTVLRCFRSQGNMWKELFFYISQLVISSTGRPLTPPRDSDTQKGSIPTVEKEVGKQFNAVKGWEQCMSKETLTRGEEQLLKYFQQTDEALDEFKSHMKDQTKPCGKGNDLYKISSDYPEKYCDMVPVKEVFHKMDQNDPPNEYRHRSHGIGLDVAEVPFHRTSYLEELEKHKFSVRCHPAVDSIVTKRITKHIYFGVYAAFSELGDGHWHSCDFWLMMTLVALLWFVRLYLHYCSQWIFLQAVAIPVTKFQFFPHTVDLCYQNSLVHTSEEMAVVVVGPLTLNTVMLLMVLMRWACQLLFGSFPSFLSKLIMAWGLWTVLDPLAVFVVDTFLGRLHYTPGKPTADCAKLYWLFLRTEGSGIPGILITLLLYTILFFISATVWYLYFVRIHNEGWLLDIYQRVQRDETACFVPFDLEVSNQELSYIVKKAEQWRGVGGERRTVVVYDYIWKDSAKKPDVSNSDLHHQGELLKSVKNSEGITVNVAIYTIHLGGFRELYRHFLRLPSGAIIEAFCDINGINFVYNEAGPVIQECKSEMDNTLGTSTDVKLRERKKRTARWKGITFSDCSWLVTMKQSKH